MRAQPQCPRLCVDTRFNPNIVRTHTVHIMPVGGDDDTPISSRMERVLAREEMLEKLMFPSLTGEFDEESPYARHFSGRRDNEDLQHSRVAKVLMSATHRRPSQKRSNDLCSSGGSTSSLIDGRARRGRTAVCRRARRLLGGKFSGRAKCEHASKVSGWILLEKHRGDLG